MAPEVFRHEKYSDKVDIYSMAMIMFQVRDVTGLRQRQIDDILDCVVVLNLSSVLPMPIPPQLFHGEAPFEGMPPLEAAKAAALKNLRPVISSKLAPELRRLIAACWHPDSAQRPNAREVCSTLEVLFPQEDPPPEVLTDERCCSVM